MSYSNFPNQLYVMQLESSGTMTKLGKYKVGQETELKYVVMPLYKIGAAGGSETLTMKLYGSSLYSGTAIATSSAFTLSSASFTSNTNAIGTIAFTFNRECLNPNLWYYIAITTTNYTKGTSYLAAILDWPNALNTTVTTHPPVALSFTGYRELTYG
jgi:hypothetical protein